MKRYHWVEGHIEQIEEASKHGRYNTTFVLNDYDCFPYTDEKFMPDNLMADLIKRTLDFWREQLAELKGQLQAYEVDTSRAEVVTHSRAYECGQSLRSMLGGPWVQVQPDNGQGYASFELNGGPEERENVFWRATQEIAHK